MIGQRVNNYEIVSLLGEGGMGAVYLATHPFMGRKAAIKVLRRELVEDRALVERFMNEARAANAIHHPNIIDIIDVGLLPSGVPYLMMELLEGETLARRIQDSGQLAPALAIDIAVQTAAALGAAHKKSIVHRDLKPENLFLVPDDERPHGVQVKVLDFGIAKLRGELAGNSAKTQDGALMGTPPYMSPEQCRGLMDEIDERTDIYAMGIILYQMLVGTPPFVSAGWGEVVLMHLTQPPRPPRATNPELAPALESVVLTALAKKREERFASMGAMEAALRAAGGLTPIASGPRVPVSFRAAPAPAAGPSSTNTTTFKNASGEIDALAGLEKSRGRRWLAGVGGIAAAAALVLVAIAVGRSRGPRGPEAAAPSPTALAVPPTMPATAPPPTPVPTAPPPTPVAPPRPEPGAASKPLPPPALAPAPAPGRHHAPSRAPRSAPKATPGARPVVAPTAPTEAPPPAPTQAPKPKLVPEKW